MKRKTLSLTLCLLTCLALIGVGFAAWLITYNGTAEAQGTIHVETVSEKHYIVNVTTNNLQIKFGTPATMNTSNHWLTATDDTEKEQLSVTFIVRVDQKLDSTTTNGIAVNLAGKETTHATAPTLSWSEVTASDPTDWQSAITKKYVTAFSINVAEELLESGQYQYNVTVSTAWGSHFGGDHPQNPYKYYNSHNMTDIVPTTEIDYATDAKNSLGELYSLLKDVTFSLTLTVK